MNDLRTQLSPGWSGVNIAITVVLFLMAWPLGLLMIGYIVWGRQLGLDFAAPETIPAFGRRLSSAWRAGTDSWGRGNTLSTGTPNGARRPAGNTPRGRVASDEPETTATDATLRAERDALGRERQAFEAEKREWRESRAPLDS